MFHMDCLVIQYISGQVCRELRCAHGALQETSGELLLELYFKEIHIRICRYAYIYICIYTIADVDQLFQRLSQP